MRLEDIVRRIIKRGKDSDIIIDDISINQAKKLLHEGYESLLQDDLENAKELYLQVLELDPNDSRALNNLGYILQEYGFKNASLNLYNQVVELNNDEKSVSLSIGNKGSIALDSGKIEEAEKYYKKALDVNPKNASAYHNSALILSKERNNMKEAEKYYEKALDLYAEDKFKSSLLSDWGFDYLELGDKSRSEKLLRKAIALNPSNSMALSNFGSLRYEQGKNEEAEKLWGEVIRINNSRDALAYAYNNLGYLYKENGKNEDAILNFLSSIEVCPSYKIEYEKVQKLIYKGLQECFEKMGCVRDVISIMKDYFTHNKSKEAGTFVLSLLDYVGDNRAEDEVWQ
ncbi:MAG: tetratricopeptide repeat protein [Nanoarchaeota archaeon]|nr:tetratricopeptide repeat protein [Nanoarchaeota archaeon]